MAIVITVTDDIFIITFDEVTTLTKNKDDILCCVDPLDTTIVQIFETSPTETQRNLILASKYTNFSTPTGSTAIVVCYGINQLLINNSPLNEETPYIYLSSNITQSLADPTVGQVIIYDINEQSNKITHSTSLNPSRIQFDYSGVYNIHLEAIVASSSANKEAYFWIRINGVDVPRSTTQINIVNSSDQKAVTLTWVFSFTTGQYMECVFGGSSTSLTLPYISTITNPIRPTTPSVNLSIELI